MRKLLTLGILILIANINYGQTLETGNVIEYSLRSEDCNSGTFYLGRFLVGKYEISANISGTHANNTGWKIIIGTSWSGSRRIFNKIYSNINGDFIYQKYDNAYFDLWWDAKYGSSGQLWTPHIKVEYQSGNCLYSNPEPTRSNEIVLAGNCELNVQSFSATGNVGIGTNNPEAKLHVENGSLDIGNKGDENELRFRRSSDGAPVGVIRLKDSNEFKFNHAGGGGHFTFYTNFGGEVEERFRITNNGKVGIGTIDPQAKLHVSGEILADEIRVEDIAATDLNLAGDLAANNITLAANGQTADFVFADDYNLKPLSEVESFIKTNKHLPEIPSAAQMEEQGVNLAEMNKLLLQKVEELTLYVIEKDKRVEKLEGERENLEERLERLEKLLLIKE